MDKTFTEKFQSAVAAVKKFVDKMAAPAPELTYTYPYPKKEDTADAAKPKFNAKLLS